MERSKRIFYFDVLRAMAIIGIVFCHASVAFIMSGVERPDFYISAFFDCFRDFSIPIFVMLSGALLISKKDSFMDFSKKRLSRIFVPFAFWVAVYVAYSSVFITHGFKLSNAIDIFFGTSATLGVAFWFIWMIVIVYFLIFIINKLMDHALNLIGILTFLSLIYILTVQFGLFNPYSSKIVYFVSFITYVLFGYFISSNDYLESLMGPEKIVIVTLALSLFSYLFYVFAFVVPTSISHGQFINMGYFNIPILFISVNIFLLFKYLSKVNLLSKVENGRLGFIITAISRYSFGIYLAHYVVLHSIRMNLVKIVDFTSQSSLIWIPALVILTLVISLVILKILDKIPVFNKFTGNS